MRAVTHDGVFHADDVLAAAVLVTVDASVVIERTRDAARIASADIVFDVGAEYDEARCRFDHHQRGRARKYSNGIEYSSAGLVWAAFGHQLCDGEVFSRVTAQLFMPVDATDNGQPLSPSGDGAFAVGTTPVRALTPSGARSGR